MVDTVVGTMDGEERQGPAPMDELKCASNDKWGRGPQNFQQAIFLQSAITVLQHQKK